MGALLDGSLFMENKPEPVVVFVKQKFSLKLLMVL